MLEIGPACLADLKWLQGEAALLWTPAHLREAWTAREAGEPVCAWGLLRLWPEVGVLWFADGPRLAGHPQRWQIARAIWRQWQRVQGSLRYVEACALDTRLDSHNLLRYLGFRLACVKPGYGLHGETMLEYQWVRPDKGE
jgi:hypothetical protein